MKRLEVTTAGVTGREVTVHGALLQAGIEPGERAGI
jgi:hypothetical protein